MLRSRLKIKRLALIENNRSEKVVKSGHIFENPRRIVGYLTRSFGNMDYFTDFVADLFFNQAVSNIDCLVELKNKKQGEKMAVKEILIGGKDGV